MHKHSAPFLLKTTLLKTAFELQVLVHVTLPIRFITPYLAFCYDEEGVSFLSFPNNVISLVIVLLVGGNERQYCPINLWKVLNTCGCFIDVWLPTSFMPPCKKNKEWHHPWTEIPAMVIYPAFPTQIFGWNHVLGTSAFFPHILQCMWSKEYESITYPHHKEVNLINKRVLENNLVLNLNKG